jgi:hypothetical protein
VQRLLDPNAGLRTAVQWRQLLSGLVESLSTFTCVELRPTSWVVSDDRTGYASACNCVNVRGTVNSALRLDACGTVCVTVNFGEEVWASCDLLLFAAGQRVRGPAGLDIVFLSFGTDGWDSKGWVMDENGEWEAHTTDDWWNEE